MFIVNLASTCLLSHIVVAEIQYSRAFLLDFSGLGGAKHVSCSTRLFNFLFFMFPFLFFFLLLPHLRLCFLFSCGLLSKWFSSLCYGNMSSGANIYVELQGWRRQFSTPTPVHLQHVYAFTYLFVFIISLILAVSFISLSNA